MASHNKISPSRIENTYLERFEYLAERKLVLKFYSRDMRLRERERESDEAMTGGE